MPRIFIDPRLKRLVLNRPVRVIVANADKMQRKNPELEPPCQAHGGLLQSNRQNGEMHQGRQARNETHFRQTDVQRR